MSREALLAKMETVMPETPASLSGCVEKARPWSWSASAGLDDEKAGPWQGFYTTMPKGFREF